MQALIGHIFINKEAFRARNTASKQAYKIFMSDAANKIYFIEEMVHPLSCIEEKPLDRYNSTI